MVDTGSAAMDEVTRHFCQLVIDNTIESLRSFNGEIADDQLDRIKSQWEQRWRRNL